MTDTKENKVNDANANAKDDGNAKAKKQHSKIDLKNMFHSKHNNKDNKKDSAAKTNGEAKPEEKKDEQPKAENQGNDKDTIDCEGDAKKPLDDCEGCKDEVLGETDKAVGKPITGFSEKVGASFRKWFHLAGAPKD